MLATKCTTVLPNNTINNRINKTLYFYSMSTVYSLFKVPMIPPQEIFNLSLLHKNIWANILQCLTKDCHYFKNVLQLRSVIVCYFLVPFLGFNINLN